MSSADEIPLDPWGLEVGERIEDLAALVPTQPYVSRGPSLGIAARNLLVTLAQQGRLGWLEMRRNATGVHDLVEAGAITPRGRLTDAGEALVAPLNRLAASVVIDARYGQHSSALRVHCGDGSAVISAGPSYHELRGRGAEPTADEVATDREERARIEVVANEAVPEVIARWMGLAPVWTFALHPETLPATTLESRLVDESTPPPADADDRFLRVWQEPWVVFTLGMDPGGHQWIYVHAGSTGFHTCGGTDTGQAQFVPVPSGLVWKVLVERLGQALQHPG